MADITFPQAVDALYRALDLPAPLRPELEAGRHEIVFESGGEAVAIRLALAPNGRVLLVKASEPPRFSEDASIRLEQMRQVLTTSLGLSATNRASAGLEQAGDLQQAPRLAISARISLTYPLSQIGQEIKAAVEDVMELLDWQSVHLKGGDAAGARRPSYPAGGNHFSNQEEFLVLRP